MENQKKRGVYDRKTKQKTRGSMIEKQKNAGIYDLKTKNAGVYGLKTKKTRVFKAYIKKRGSLWSKNKKQWIYGLNKIKTGMA